MQHHREAQAAPRTPGSRDGEREEEKKRREYRRLAS